MTPSGIEPATFRFVAQYLNHCATAVVTWKIVSFINLLSEIKLMHRRLFYFHDATVPSGPGSSHYARFMITLGHTTLVKIPLGE